MLEVYFFLQTAIKNLSKTGRVLDKYDGDNEPGELKKKRNIGNRIHRFVNEKTSSTPLIKINDHNFISCHVCLVM